MSKDTLLKENMDVLDNSKDSELGSVPIKDFVNEGTLEEIQDKYGLNLKKFKKDKKKPYKVVSDSESKPFYCFAYNEKDAIKRSQFNPDEGIIRVQEVSPEDVKRNMVKYYRPNRKIFAIVKNEDFFLFSKLCKENGYENVGEALSDLVKKYISNN